MKNIAQLVEAAHAQSTKSGFWSHEEDCDAFVYGKAKTPGEPSFKEGPNRPPECHCVNLDLNMKIDLIHSELSEALEEFRLKPSEHGGALNEILYDFGSRRADGETILLSCGDCRRKDPGHLDHDPKAPVHSHKPVGFMAELADVAIRIFDLTGELRRDSLLQGQFESRYFHARPAEPTFASSLKEAHRRVASAGSFLTPHEPERIDGDEAVFMLALVLISLEDIVTVTSGGGSGIEPRGNLDEAIRIKMAYNATRPFKHGKTC